MRTLSLPFSGQVQLTSIILPLLSNFFAELPTHLSAETASTLAEAVNIRIERIVSWGHASAEGFWYDQDQHEFVVLLQGAARLRFEDKIVELAPGDFINIAARQRHRVDWTTPEEPTVWLTVFYQ